MRKRAHDPPRLRLGMPANFHYVYILVSLENPNRHYVGITQDLDGRLIKHNQGGCNHTKMYMPWQIETAIAFRSQKKAIEFEQYLKSGSGRTFSKRHF